MTATLSKPRKRKNAIQVETETRLVNPVEAQAWLDEANVNNRTLRETVVKRYARDIENGLWLDTYDPIKFDTTGKLIDGQHRLAAVVMADEPVRFTIVRNLDPVTQAVVDTGSVRTLKDALDWSGFTNTAQLAASVTMAIQYEGDGFPNRTFRPTVSEALAWLRQNPGIVECVRMVANLRLPKGLTRSLPSVLLYECDEDLVEDIEAFFTQVATGEGLNAGDPALALRRYLEPRAAGYRPGRERVAAVTIKALNAYLLGDTINQLKWTKAGKNPEAFPRLVTADEAAGA